MEGFRQLLRRLSGCPIELAFLRNGEILACDAVVFPKQARLFRQAGEFRSISARLLH